MKPECVHLHAFTTDEAGNWTACDEHDANRKGWNVWVRLSDGEDADEFDIGEDEDFPTSEAAMERAKVLAALYAIPIEEY